MDRHRATTTAAGDAATSLIDEAVWQRIVAGIDARTDQLVKFRRRLHATPEPSEQEFTTTALIAETLSEAGLLPRVMNDGIGVIADVDVGASKAGAVAGRAELDCVRVADEKQVPYASTRPGLCHACGHDAHATMLLGAALTLADQSDAVASLGLRHNLRVIFQPAEETVTGARSMIEQGAIDGVAAMIALHVEPFLETGRIEVRHGAMTAACSVFHLTVSGRSGHSARPHEAIDPIPAAVNLVSMFYQLAPRGIDSRRSLSLTIGTIQAGSTFNAIPDRATLAGTLRTARVEDMEAAKARMQAVCRGVAEATGCNVALEFPDYAPPTTNDPVVLSAVLRAAEALLGPSAIQWLDAPSMGAEDFAFFQELVPGAFIRLGAAKRGTEQRRLKPLHSSRFDIDEDALPIGTKLMARSLLELGTGLHAPAGLI